MYARVSKEVQKINIRESCTVQEVLYKTTYMLAFDENSYDYIIFITTGTLCLK